MTDLRPILPTELLSDSVGEFGQSRKRAENSKSASRLLALFQLLFVLQLLLDELKIRLVIGTVVQPDIELAAGAGPGFASLPHIDIGI